MMPLQSCLRPCASLAGATLLVLLWLGHPAAAAEPADEAQLVAQGVALRVKGQDEAAFDVFKQAWERYKSPRAQAQLGLTAQALGRWALAETHLQAALLATSDSWIASKRKTLEQSLAVVRKRVGRLDVQGDVPGAEVLVDGQPVGRLPLAGPLPRAAGTVVLQVQAPGHVAVQRQVTIIAEQLSRESVHLVRLSLDSAPPVMAPSQNLTSISLDQPAPPPTTRSSRRRQVLFAALGATVASAGLATWSGITTLSARDRYVADPTEQAYRQGQRLELRTNILLASTGLLAAGALAWGLITDWGAP